MSLPLGGSLAALMATGDELVDGWLQHCKETHPTTPELLAAMFIQNETNPNKTATLAVLAASAIQRLAAQMFPTNPEETSG